MCEVEAEGLFIITKQIHRRNTCPLRAEEEDYIRVRRSAERELILGCKLVVLVHAMTVKHLLTNCAKLANLKLRFFGGYNPNTLKHILGRNKVNSNTIKFLKESNIYNRV